MPLPVDPVTTDAKIPVKVDVVLIGGGIIGASTAFYLANKGFKTASDGCAAPLKAAPANADLINTAMKRFRAGYPVLADLQVKAAWGGFINSTPDARPAIPAVETLPGFHVAAGFSGGGFGLGPGAGAACREPDRRRSTDRRSAALPLRPLRRWLESPSLLLDLKQVRYLQTLNASRRRQSGTPPALLVAAPPMMRSRAELAARAWNPNRQYRTALPPPVLDRACKPLALLSVVPD